MPSPSLAQVIGKHHVKVEFRGTGDSTWFHIRCGCGWRTAEFQFPDRGYTAWASADAHVASAAHQAGALWVPGVTDEQLDEVDDVALVAGNAWVTGGFDGEKYDNARRAELLRLAREQAKGEG